MLNLIDSRKKVIYSGIARFHAILDLLTVVVFCAVDTDSIEQRVNYSQSAGSVSRSQWTAELTVPATSIDLLYIVTVNVSDEYDNLEYRIVCNWLDFGKIKPGRASPPTAVIKPATYCICKFSTAV